MEEIKITDNRIDFYFKLENAVVDEQVFDNIYEAHLFVILSRYCNNNKTAYPSLETLAKKCYCSKPTIIKAIKGLEEKGFISKVQRFNQENNSYNSTLYLVNNINNLVNEVYKGSKGDLQGVVNEVYKGSKGDLHKKEKYKKNNIKKEQLKNINKKINKKNEIETSLEKEDISENLKSSLKEFIEYRREIKKPIRSYKSISLILSKLGRDFRDEEHLINSIEQSIQNGYQGVFPVKETKQASHKEESYVERRLREIREMKEKGIEEAELC